MKDHESMPLFEVAAASGCYLQATDGKKLLDAISSWWCKSLGHQHPRIKRAVSHQLELFEHTMLAGTTNDVIVTLSEKLAALNPLLSKVLYAGDGSSAVEIALKLSLHAQKISGHSKRTKFLTLENAYHGETVGAMSVSDLGIYRDAYQPMLFEVEVIPVNYVSGEEDAKWHDCNQHWQQLEAQLARCEHEIAAVIVEPIVQGAGGMRVYSMNYLQRLREWTRARGIYLIADEIMTGLGRTGKMLACEHAGITPDFLCLSKGLTSGWLPLSAVLTTQAVYDLFYQDYDAGHSFLHSHTYSGNPLAASAAVATLAVIAEENIVERTVELGNKMRSALARIANQTGLLKNLRGIGAIVAADFQINDNRRRAGLDVYRAAYTEGVLLRPLGDTIYWLPPLIMQENELTTLEHVTKRALISALK
jgi:adenosylmethionine-8-amino-7-oxononanoate aminotransferase